MATVPILGIPNVCLFKGVRDVQKRISVLVISLRAWREIETVKSQKNEGDQNKFPDRGRRHSSGNGCRCHLSIPAWVYVW